MGLKKGDTRHWQAGPPPLTGRYKTTLNLTEEIVRYVRQKYGSLGAGVRKIIQDDMARERGKAWSP